ncbi:MAG: exopolysaccharide Pel transporter PelG [Spirochaetales bacterium]|nr:exopolysaccharide Pel transporter PelG [Spirochaetales bacterium]
MAGIGFVLRTVLRKQGLFSILKVALIGTIIVAGPWLLSIFGIFLIGKFAGNAVAESRGLFMALIIYSYAFSLAVFGGFHYVFTRQVADAIYENRKNEAGAVLVVFSAFVAVSAALISGTALFLIDLSGIAWPLIFRLSGIILFVSINLMWLLMIFISLLKRFLLIFFIYLSGMAVSFGLVFLLGKIFLSAGAVLGFAAGQLLIVILLGAVSLKEYKPCRPSVKKFLHYMVRFKFLLFSGIFYYWGMWIDKIVFWIIRGDQVNNTFFRVFEVYDIPVYIANLTMIPGLIFFMVVNETNFFVRLREFLNTIHTGILKRIQDNKKKLARQAGIGIRDQSLFQGIFTAAFILLARELTRYVFNTAVNLTVFRILTGAVFFHLMFLTLMVFLFYLQQYKKTFAAALVFFLVNSVGSVLTALSGINELCGLGYLAGGFTGSIAAVLFLVSSVRNYDKTVFIMACRG